VREAREAREAREVREAREAIGVALDVEARSRLFTGAVDVRVGRANLDGSAADLVTGSGALTGSAVAPRAGR
jgi:hypothetical protein